MCIRVALELDAEDDSDNKNEDQPIDINVMAEEAKSKGN
jgi:hypothetical protein